MVSDLIAQLKILLNTSRQMKESLRQIATAEKSLDPVLRHDILHHCMLQDQIPEQYTDESENDYKIRLLQIRRRLDESNRLAGCVLMMFEMINNGKKI